MKMFKRYTNSTNSLVALSLGVMLVGCAQEAELVYNNASQSLKALPQILDAKTTRAASDQSLNETALSNLTVQLYDQEFNEQKVNKTFTSGLSNGTAVEIDHDKDGHSWKVANDLQETYKYTVRASANDQNATDGILEDADIWKPYDATSNSGKTFVMSQISDYTVTKEPNQTIPVTLTRAAAKIQLTLHVSVDGYTAGNPTWNLENYNTKTTVFTDNTAEATNIVSGADVEPANASIKNSDGSYTITTYSYAMTWSGTDDAPKFKVKIPLTAAGATEAESNYYEIPVRDIKGTEKKLERNYIYKIDATITSKGSSSKITYNTESNVKYDFLPWSEGDETTVNGDSHYLTVTPTKLVMKNISSDTQSITYNSSDKMKDITIDKVYYYDKNGNKKEVSTGNSQYPTVTYNQSGTGDNRKGTINIQSAIPTNLTVKFIFFTVTNESGDKVQVVVKQYPIKYVQNIAGWYSTRDTEGENWIDWQTDQTSHTTEKTSSKDIFQAKVYENGIIYTYNDSPNGGGGGSWWDRGSWGGGSSSSYKATHGRNGTGQNNNHMYVIQITNTNGNYVIAKPQFNNLQSSDQTVSPAFMLGSQLGTVSPCNNFTTASQHCANYVEVGVDGTRYDDWRLPTQAEINSIVDFQNDSKASETIDRVLVGYYYWAANGGVSEKVPGATNDNSPGAVRCVRDLTVKQVNNLENTWE